MRRALHLTATPCLCGEQATRAVLTRDRYLLPVHVAVCAACGLVHTSRNIQGSALTAFYRDHYRRYYEAMDCLADIEQVHHIHQHNATYRLREIGAVVPKISSVLEIGAGLGYFLRTCRDHGAKEVLGFEPGTLFRHYGMQQLGLGAQLRGDDFLHVDSLPFAPRLIVLFHVFEHLADPRACLRWVAQHMHGDGTLVIEVPDIAGDWRRMGLFHFHLAHRWYFSAQTLSNLLAEEGFAPYFVSRSDTDGIYPGNLRIFAHKGVAGATYPLPHTPIAQQEQAIRNWVRPLSIHNGIPRALWRMARRNRISKA